MEGVAFEKTVGEGGPETAGQEGRGGGGGDGERERWTVGGLSLGEDVPICKHLLACVLVERTGLFAGFVREREVGVEEWAGWAAGWGG